MYEPFPEFIKGIKTLVGKSLYDGPYYKHVIANGGDPNSGFTLSPSKNAKLVLNPEVRFCLD